MADDQNNAGAGKKLTEEQREYVKYLEYEEKSRARSYDLASLLGEEIEKQQAKMKGLLRSAADIHANIQKTTDEYVQQQRVVNVLGEKHRVQVAELIKQKQKTVALEAAQAADAQKQMNFDQAKTRAQQTINNLQQDATRLKQKERDLTRDLRDAMRAGDTAAVARIQREQAALARQQASNKGNMTQARNRLALAETELNTVNSTMAARAKELKQSKEDEQLKEKAANATAEQLDYAKTMADYKKRVMDDTSAFGKIEIDRLEEQHALEMLTLEQMQNRKEIFGEIDQFLGAASQEYGKIKGLLIDISKGGATAWLAVIKASLDRWAELDAAAASFRNTTKLIVTQTRQLDKAAREVNVQLQNMGVSIGEVYEAAQSLTQEFQVVGLVTKEMMADTAQMSASLGVAVADSAKFRGLFTSISKSAGMTATQSMQATAALAEMAGVAPAAVLKDMAEASAETLSFLAKSPIALMKASVEARRLGTTVNSLSKSARGFLNYQDSITSELEASALIGKSLNFQEARAAAYAGDVVKSRELALKQLEKAGDFTKLNVYQQEALAKAAGMTVDEVIKQQNQQKMLAEFRANATGKDKEMLDKYEATQRKIAENEKAAKEDLVGRGREMVKQQMMQAEMNKLQNAFKGIWTDITDALLPIANAIMPPIIVSVRLIGGLFKVIGALIRGFLKPFDVFTKTLRSGEDNSQRLEEFLTKVGEVIEEYIIPSVETFGELLGNVFKMFAFVATGFGKIVTEFKPFVATLDAVGKAVVWIGSTFGKIFPSIANIGKAILTFITAPLNKILPIIQNVFAVFSKLTGAISGGTSIFSPVLKVFSGIGKFIGVFGKGIPIIGQVISVLQVLWELGKSLFSIWSDDNLSFGDKIIASFKAVPAAIFDALIAPFIDIGAWILKKFGVDIPDDAIESFKNLAKQIFVTLMSPISTLLTIISSMFSGKSGGIASKIWEGIKSVGGAIFSALAWPFKKIWQFVSGLFSGEGGESIIGSILNGLKSAASGILSVITWPFRKMWEFVTGLFSGGGGESIIGTILGGLKSAAMMYFNIITWPYRKLWQFVSGLFSGEGSGIIGSIIDGMKNAVVTIFNVLTLPHRMLIKFISTIFSNAGEIGKVIVKGIKSMAGMLFDVLTWPFRKVVDFVSGLFGGSGEMGTNIIKGIKGTVETIFDVFVKAFSSLVNIITWPFRKAAELISKIPFISKLFGGNSSDATAKVSGDAKVKADGSSTAPMEVKGLTELKDSIVKLTEAITKLNGGAGAATAGGGGGGGMCCDAVVGKLDQLITLMSEGNIGVNIDGVKASKLLARAST